MSFSFDGEVPIASERDILTVRRVVRDATVQFGFGMTDTTRIVTAASELARNIFRYAAPGVMRWRKLVVEGRVGVELQFEDHGPGIANVEQRMRDGFTSSGGGMGLGLRGSKRLMDELEVQTEVGKGTLITARKWRLN